MYSLYILDEQLERSAEPGYDDKPKRGRPTGTTNSRVVPELGTGTNGGVEKFVPLIVAAATPTSSVLTRNARNMSTDNNGTTGTDRGNKDNTPRVYHELCAKAICEGDCTQEMGGANSSGNIKAIASDQLYTSSAWKAHHKKWEEDFNAEVEAMYEAKYGKTEGCASAQANKRGRKQKKEKIACGGDGGGTTKQAKEGAEGKPKRKCPKYKIRITNGDTTSDSGTSGGDTNPSATSGGDTSDADARFAAEFGEPATSAN